LNTERLTCWLNLATHVGVLVGILLVLAELNQNRDCNSLHTNAYDEAIITLTEESVRRAVATQMIINKELGLNFCENPGQGSFIVDKLTDLAEEAVYKEFCGKGPVT
jgi:AICAR transformylase/IMP cyclohydrolase PurH